MAEVSEMELSHPRSPSSSHASARIVRHGTAARIVHHDTAARLAGLRLHDMPRGRSGAGTEGLRMQGHDGLCSP